MIKNTSACDLNIFEIQVQILFNSQYHIIAFSSDYTEYIFSVSINKFHYKSTNYQL